MYANIESVLLYKNARGDVAYFELKPSGNYQRVIKRPDNKNPGEFALNGAKVPRKEGFAFSFRLNFQPNTIFINDSIKMTYSVTLVDYILNKGFQKRIYERKNKGIAC